MTFGEADSSVSTEPCVRFGYMQAPSDQCDCVISVRGGDADCR